jgi:hypothetical protein
MLERKNLAVVGLESPKTNILEIVPRERQMDKNSGVSQVG